MPIGTYRYLLCALTVLGLVACGDDGGGSGGPDESDLPTDNGLFNYVPGEEGAAPGYYVEAAIDGGSSTLTSNEIELRLITEAQFEEQSAAAASEGQSSAALKAMNPMGTAQGSPPLPQIDFGSSASRDPNPRTMESMLLALDSRVPVRRWDVGAQQLQDRDGDGITEDPELPACTGGQIVGCSDNCPFVENPEQTDENLDRIGDACEGDPDGDGVESDGDGSGTEGDAPCASVELEGCDDNCPNVSNPRQWDVDEDGIGDACDTDRDGNGTADLDEGAVDHDNDGIPTSSEGDVDSDGDGSPDYLDPDDDNDGIPTRDENDNDGVPDPDRDTDGDNIPDHRDEDSDGDGIDDRNEGTRDTDGDGDPDSRDPDDDGDGTDTADEYDSGDQDEDGDGIPNHLDDNPNDGCENRKVGARYQSIPTFGGFTFWTAWTGSVSTLVGPCVATDAYNSCGVTDYTWAIHSAPDGLYFSLQLSQGNALPPDLAGFAIVESIGMMHSPEPDPNFISANTMSAGQNIGIAYEAMGFFQGWSILEDQNTGFTPPARFMQFDIGVGISIGLLDFFGFSLFPSISISLTDGGITIKDGVGDDAPSAFILISGWGEQCPGSTTSPALATARKQGTDNPGSDAIAAWSQRAGSAQSSTPTSVEDSYRQEVGASMSPLLNMLTQGAGFGSAQNVPAPTAADWVAEFTNRSGGDACENCVNMSIDGIITQTGRDASNGGNLSGLAGEARETAGEFLAAWPERERMASLMNLAAGGSINAGTELAFAVSARRRGDPNRFAASQVIDIPAQIGQPASFTVTAEEIADLVGFPAADIEGATVCVENNPKIDRTCGTIEDGDLTGTITPDSPEPYVLPVTVDLTTAEGRFGDADVRSWTVLPAVRRFIVEPLPAERVLLAAPGTIKSGAPATLNATLLGSDGRLAPETATYTLYDGNGDVVDSVTSDDGAAIFQVQPQSRTPSISDVEARTVSANNADVPGYVVTGRFISRDARVLIDGTDVEELGYLFTVADSVSVGIAVVDDAVELSPGSHSFVIENPGGERSTTFEATIP